jgi:hypothetical protein
VRNSFDEDCLHNGGIDPGVAAYRDRISSACFDRQ